MRAGKRKELEARGWKVGGAKEFLGLTEQETAYIELRVKLAQGLKAKRNSRGLSQTELAKVVRSSQSRVAKMEAGDPTVVPVAFGGISLPPRKTGWCDGTILNHSNSFCGAGKLYDLLYYGIRSGKGASMVPLVGLLFSLSDVKGRGIVYGSNGSLYSASAERIMNQILNSTGLCCGAGDSVNLSLWRYFALKYLNFYFDKTVGSFRAVASHLEQLERQLRSSMPQHVLDMLGQQAAFVSR
mgnify:CR=1 FL=1